MLALLAQVVPVNRAADTYLDRGLLGATCVILAIVVVILWRWAASKDTKIETLQAQRVTDAQTVQATLLRNSEQTTTALTNAANAIEAHTTALGELRTSFKDVSDDIRRVRR